MDRRPSFSGCTPMDHTRSDLHNVDKCVHFVGVSWGCGRTPLLDTEKTHADMERTCKLLRNSGLADSQSFSHHRYNETRCNETMLLEDQLTVSRS